MSLREGVGDIQNRSIVNHGSIVAHRPRLGVRSPCADGAATRAQPSPREPGDAALARARPGEAADRSRGQDPGPEAVGRPTSCLPGSKQARDDRHAGVRVPATEPQQVGAAVLGLRSS